MQIFAGKSSFLPFLAGFSAGALCAALLEPKRGAARRAKLKDKTLSWARQAGREAVRRGRDLQQRAEGAVHEAKARVQPEDVPDEVLVERVRAQIGRPVSHPRAIEVTAHDGEVTLSGPIVPEELDDLLQRVARVRGVRSVNNLLRPDDGRNPSLQH